MVSRVAEIRALREKRDRARQLLAAYDEVREDIARSCSVPAILDTQRQRLNVEVNAHRDAIRVIRSKCIHAWEAHIGSFTRMQFWRCVNCDDVTEVKP